MDTPISCIFKFTCNNFIKFRIFSRQNYLPTGLLYYKIIIKIISFWKTPRTQGEPGKREAVLIYSSGFEIFTYPTINSPCQQQIRTWNRKQHCFRLIFQSSLSLLCKQKHLFISFCVSKITSLSAMLGTDRKDVGTFLSKGKKIRGPISQNIL